MMMKDSYKRKNINYCKRNIWGKWCRLLQQHAKKQIAKLEKLSLDKVPICMAKTQYSLSDNPSLLGRPTEFRYNSKRS